jgi:hypothetical protein
MLFWELWGVQGASYRFGTACSDKRIGLITSKKEKVYIVYLSLV